ncbi:MAG: hypothetical protein JJU11_00680 [Candidatus Sumerlaeia bacterium]|nr:hypothetical protein [Candidatus Sumerlaeia bacterium]
MGIRSNGSAPTKVPVDDREARILASYLVNRLPRPEHRLRYREAVRRLAIGGSRALRLGLRFPVLLGLLDGGCGLVRPDDPLRQRLLVMAAVLEATTDHVEEFLPAPRPIPVLVAVCLYHGVKAAIKGVVGAPFVLLMGRGE